MVLNSFINSMYKYVQIWIFYKYIKEIKGNEIIGMGYKKFSML
jgi:hypothetical protein